ncbi:MAG TPA: 4Fe-4S dicluster domain-containing protein, partial [Candidatus Goldiibacteriota bacterium]|nr:4Fe-4S dicluster domain-containing protein [Candidatus Goldiibacteriota bacterium]
FTGGNAAKLGRLYPTDEEAKEIIARMSAETGDCGNVELITCAEACDAAGGIGNFNVKVRQVSRGVTGPVSWDEFKAAEALCPVEVPDAFNFGISNRKALYMPHAASYPAVPAIDWEACTKCGKCGQVLKERLNLEKKEKEIEIKAGVVIVASGFEHYEPYEGEYGYKTLKNVVTLQQLIRMLDDKGPTGGKLPAGVKTIGFIHCVGSRELEGVKKLPGERRVNAHCSRVCCTVTLQAINEIKEKYPDANVLDFYQDIRTYGRDTELKYYDTASANGALFFRYDPRQLPEVGASGNKIKVKMKDLLSGGEEIEAEMDMLVLSAGIMPGKPGAVADKFKMPQSADRFLQEVHPKLRPVETAIGGIFLAGTVQAPFDTTETTAVAGAAAVKAAAILEGGSVHLDPHVAFVNTEKCRGHGLCVKSCPAKGAIFMNAQNKAEVNPMLCISCGNCVAVCPERAVDVKGYEIEGFERVVEEILKK